MRGKVAKELRREAQYATRGLPLKRLTRTRINPKTLEHRNCTRYVYQALKKQYKPS